MKRLLLLACAVTLAAGSQAQLPNWDTLPMRYDGFITCMFSDTADGKLYIGGSIRDGDHTATRALVLRWDGVAFDTLPSTPIYQINAITRYQGKIYVGGWAGVARLDGGQWTRLDSTALVIGFSHYQGKLIVCGHYHAIGGQNLHSAAFYDGQAFTPLPGQLDTIAPGILGVKSFSNAVEYKGQLYLGGNINPTNNPLISEIIRFDGTKWTDVGGGIRAGGLAGLWDVFVWGDDLYAIGQFGEGPTSPGNNIARWDGQQWHRLRGGAGSGSTAIGDAVVYNNKLYVSGSLPTVDGMAANNFARWDGGQWCVYPDTLHVNYTLAVHGGNLYAGNFCVFTDTACGRILRWRGIDTVAECGGIDPTGVVGGQVVPAQSFSISPNPTTTALTISWGTAPDGPMRYTLTDAAGRIVVAQASSAVRHSIVTGNLASGLYLLHMATVSGKVFTEKVVRQ